MVWQRDGGRCAFIATGGRRCSERAFLEIHHVEPYGIGGETTAGNLALRCRSHNVHEAELAFGADRVGRRATDADVDVATRSGASWQGRRGTEMDVATRRDP
jgi:hypothetical protein